MLLTNTISDKASVHSEVILNKEITVEEFATIRNSTIDNKCTIHPYAYIDDSYIGSTSSILPGAMIVHSTCGIGCAIGMEIKRSTLGNYVKAKHAGGTLADIQCGDNVNFGAGSLYANYDGKHKRSCTIGSNVMIGANVLIIGKFAGSETQHRQIGNNVFIAAGIILRHDVPSHHTVYPTAIARKKFPNHITYANDEYAIINYDKIFTEGLLAKHYTELAEA